MQSYKYTGDYEQITIAGVMFEKNKPVIFNDQEVGGFLASGVVHAMLANGDLAVETPKIKAETKANIKTTKTNTKATDD